MTKRVFAVVMVGLFATLAVPSIALAQDAQGPSEETTTAGTQGEPAGTETEAVTEESNSVVTEETSGDQSSEEGATTDAPETDAVEPQVASDEAVSSSVSEATQTSTQTSVATGPNRIGGKLTLSKKAKSATGKKSAKKCSTASRSGGPVAQASAPPAPGCLRVNGTQGTIGPFPDGTTLQVDPTGNQGEVTVTVTNGTFTGTIFVKGGPSDPGQPCSLSGGVGTTVTCFAPVNPNNNKLYGVSHVDACPGASVPPGTPGTQGGQQDGGGRGGGQRREQTKKKKKAAAESVAPAPVAAAAVAAPGGLPVTGLPVVWLVLVGGGLLASGLTLRRLT